MPQIRFSRIGYNSEDSGKSCRKKINPPFSREIHHLRTILTFFSSILHVAILRRSDLLPFRLSIYICSFPF